MQNEDKSGCYLGSLENYLGDFEISSGTYQEEPRPIDYGDVSILIKKLRKAKIKVDKANSKIIVKRDKGERVSKLDLQPKPSSLLIGYSLVIKENLEVIIRGYSEGVNHNPNSEPSFINPSIKGIFMFYPLDQKKGKPSSNLINRVEGIIMDYYSEKFK